MSSPFVAKLVQEANDLEKLQLASDSANSDLALAQSSLAKVQSDAASKKTLADADYNQAVATALSAKTSAYTSAEDDVSAAKKVVDDAIAAANDAASKLQAEQTYLINSIKNLSFDPASDPSPDNPPVSDSAPGSQ